MRDHDYLLLVVIYCYLLFIISYENLEFRNYKPHMNFCQVYPEIPIGREM